MKKFSKIEDLMNELNKYFRVYVSEFATKDGQDEALRNKDKTMIRCLFPDHEDKSASMHLNEHSAFCYKCGSMNIFKAANVYEGKPLTKRGFIEENVFYLAKKFDLSLEGLTSETNEELEEKLKITEFFEMMSDHILQNIESRRTEEYLDKRDIPTEVAEIMGIGYLDYKKFNQQLLKKGLTPSDYEQYGYKDENFTNTKLTFILRDEYGKAMSFATREMVFEEKIARKKLRKYLDKELVNKTSKRGLKDLVIKAVNEGMTKEDAEFVSLAATIPKYKNGNENLLFKKRNSLYGLHVAKRHKTTFSTIYLVEGYMDCITSYKNKNYCVVGYSSADVSDEQLEKLRQIGFAKIVIIPDSDEVGQEKIEKIIKLNKQRNLNVEIGKIKGLEEYENYIPKDLDEAFTLVKDTVIEIAEEQGKTINPDKLKIDLEDIIDVMPMVVAEYQFLKEKGSSEKELFNELARTLSVLDNPIERRMTLNELRPMFKGEELSLLSDAAEFYIKFKKDKLAEDILKQISYWTEEVKENPHEFFESLDRMKNHVEEKLSKGMKKQESYYERCKKQHIKSEQSKTEPKAPRLFGFKALDDLQITEHTNVMIAGKPNTGKTQVFINIVVQILMSDPNASVVYFSLDDSFNKVKHRMMSCMGGLPYKFVENPYYHDRMGIFNTDIPKKERIDTKKRYDSILKRLEQWIDEKRLIIVGSDSGYSTLDHLTALIKEYNNDETVSNSHKNLILDPASKFIINNDPKPIATISNYVKNSIGAQFDYVTIQNYELTKVGIAKTKLVEYEDMSGGKEVAYDGDVVFNLYQPLHDLGEDKTETFWLDNFNNVQPVVILENAKDKISGKKGTRYFYKLEGYKTKLHEVDNGTEDYETFRTSFFKDLDKYTKSA